MRKKYQAFSASTTTISRSGAEEPGNEVNILATGLTPNCTSNLYQFFSSVSVLQLCISSAALYQFYKNSRKTCYSYRSDTCTLQEEVCFSGMNEQVKYMYEGALKEFLAFPRAL